MRQGLKPVYYWHCEVAAEAATHKTFATHKTYLRDGLSCPASHWNDPSITAFSVSVDLSFSQLQGTVKGGRHAKTRLFVHGVALDGPDVLHALGRYPPFPTLRCKEALFGNEEVNRFL